MKCSQLGFIVIIQYKSYDPADPGKITDDRDSFSINTRCRRQWLGLFVQ
jgi:hypothetical protein